MMLSPPPPFWRIGIFLGTMSLFGEAACAQKATEPCDAPELVGTSAPYDDLVCEGIRALEARRYYDAMDRFRRALSVRLHEVPNFQLFPRLAIASWHAGDLRAARASLERARLALSVLTGLLRCTERGVGFVLVDAAGEMVASPEAPEIVSRMCGADYAYLYERDSLESFVADAELIRVFLEARRVIEGG